MVPPAGTPGRPDRIRALNLPRPLEVRAAPDGAPQAVRLAGGWRAVEQVQEHWRIVDEWWRREIRRCYYRIVLDGGRLLTVFHDPLEDAWYVQPYAGGHFLC